MTQVRRSLAQNDSSSTLDKPDDKSGDKCDDKSDLKSGDKSDDKADFTSDDKSDDKSNDKADDKSNDKSNDKSDDIHPIRSHNNKGNHKRGGAAEGHHLCILALNRVNIVAVIQYVFCMSVMVGLNMCDWISCSSPVMLHVPSPLAGLQGVRGAKPPGIAGGFGGAAG